MKPEDVAVGFLASRFLAGKNTSVEDADRMLKNVGLRVDAPSMLERARSLADRKRESLRSAVEARNPEVVAALARANLADRAAEAIEGAITTGASAADPDIGVAMQRTADRFAARELQAAKGFTAALMQRELPISLADAVFAVAEYEKSPEEQARLDAARERREQERAEREAAAAEDGESPVSEAERLAADEAYREPTPEERAYFDELMDRSRFADEARRQEELRRQLAEEKEKKNADNAPNDGNADNGANEDGEGDGEGEGDGARSASEESLPFDTVRRIAPVFESADLFAQFVVEWTTDHILAKHPELAAREDLWKSPVAIKELVQTAQHILRDLSKDTLGSPSINAARNYVDQAIVNLADYRTFPAIRRCIAHIYDRIHDNALRISRRKLVRDLVRDLRRLAGIKGRFSAVAEADDRAIDAKTEQWCRWLIPYLTMTEEKLQAEHDRLSAIIERHDTEDAEYGYDKEDDTRYVEAKDRLAILNVYGGMVRWLPGRIVDARDRILEQVNGRRQDFERAREERHAANKAIRDAIIAAVEAGATPDFRKEGRAWRKTDAYIGALMGNLNLELQNLVRYCKDGAKREAALAAIDELSIIIGEASERYRLVMGQANAEINGGLEACYGSADRGIRHLLEDEIPEEAAKRIFTQSRQVRPTYGQLLQLYATTLQGDYRENAEKHGRTALLQLMEDTLTPADIRFHAWAVNWYAANRKALSDSVEEITGLPVTSPDRLYCPARMERDPDGFSTDAVAWSPVPSALNRRIAHNLDFNEAANFLALLNEQAEIRAQTIGYGLAGIRLRDIVAHHDVQKAVRKHVGKADMKRVTDHVKDVLVQGAARKDESAFFAGLNWARRWIARFYLAGNLPSALKQLASRPVWANVVGFRNAMRYYATVLTADGQQAIRDLVASDGFKARYRMGWSEETQNVLRHPSKFKTIEWIYSKGMWVNKAVDAVSCLWMAQGFYRDALKAQLDKGFSPDEAKQRALALTWSVCENGQQSGRIENMNWTQRKGGEGAAAVFQFMTAYLLQNNYELQAIRECKAGTPGAKGRLLRAMIINHVLIPGYVELVMMAWRALMGEEPLPEEPDEWPQYLKDLAWSCAFGPAAPLYMYSQMGKSLWDRLVGSKGKPTRRGAIPAEAIVYPVEMVGSLAIDLGKGAIQTFTPFDFEEEVTVEKLQEDLWKAASSVAAPVRHVRRAIKNREE